MHRIGIVIVTYESAAIITPCLDSVATAAGDDALDVAVLVVDNHSTDTGREVAAAHRSLPEVIDSGANLGYAAAINLGIARFIDRDAVLVLNPDCRLDPGALRALADHLVSTDAGIVAPLVHEPDGRVAWSIHRHPTLVRAIGDSLLGTERAGRHPRIGEQETRAERYREPHRVAWASGAVLLISTECAAATGAWDETFFLYSEESDFQLRAGRAGYSTWFVPAATTTHDGGDAPVSGRLWSLLVVNKVALYRKTHGPVATAVYRVPVLFTEAVRAIRGRRASRAAVVALLWPPRRRGLYPAGRSQPAR